PGGTAKNLRRFVMDSPRSGFLIYDYPEITFAPPARTVWIRDVGFLSGVPESDTSTEGRSEGTDQCRDSYAPLCLRRTLSGRKGPAFWTRPPDRTPRMRQASIPVPTDR